MRISIDTEQISRLVSTQYYFLGCSTNAHLPASKRYALFEAINKFEHLNFGVIWQSETLGFQVHKRFGALQNSAMYFHELNAEQAAILESVYLHLLGFLGEVDDKACFLSVESIKGLQSLGISVK
jgi:hypothetical protein